MKNLQNDEKRGRPDIIHFLLVEALSSPLNRQGKLRVWVHTYQDYCIIINPDTRLPKDFNRFKSLIEQLLVNGRTPPKGDPLLLKLKKLNASQLFDLINPDVVIGLSNQGEHRNFESIAFELCKYERPIIIIGAFPHGSLEYKRKYPVNKTLSVYPEPLEASTVNSRLIYELEKHLGVHDHK
jgi:rRNA small subunit pseudouridine methyltransferase Nep1